MGKLFIDGEYFCDTIEDKVRDFNMDGDLMDEGETKVFGETAIPYGRYEIILNMSKKFTRILPILKDVKHFTGVRIHRGNYARDSHGCILPGNDTGLGSVANSTTYEMKLVEKMFAAVVAGQRIFIEVLSDDPHM